MKKLTLFISMLLVVQVLTAKENLLTKKNAGVKKTTVSADAHGRRSVSIVVNALYIYRDNGSETVSPLCSILATDKAYVFNQKTSTYNYISCPSSSTNIVVSVGDRIELRYKSATPWPGGVLGSGPYTITQEDINNGTVELSVGYTNNEHLQK
ncbi:hypothetical protein [Chitinophaga flava]|uniref:Uncharacterized protein n=1 Tax=Chitinophaga flava TaxID=2259036 RepID=A0A365Y2E0_9BACT|nr:hypothetical protein [Chitinophaga flava]RBL92045.1 hypothetical protein DF182_05475 [Chitinophaga flava]